MENGTGNSTICDAIQTEFHDQYDVRIFQGFDKLLAGRPTLNAFALGDENVAIQQQVAALDNQIKTLQTGIGPKC
ncbi:hypothetical protein [Bifidobacterium psychraerophilum]|jgi:hypothetical protein|uniref:hypothetical protein n=1 Tax=Bifidobacterium psychraerophilum TaxID=218140 RepID=UPI0005295F45|nr:hypothetical protein [Bifidobacterium psychraerophilum]